MHGKIKCFPALFNTYVKVSIYTQNILYEHTASVLRLTKALGILDRIIIPLTFNLALCLILHPFRY